MDINSILTALKEELINFNYKISNREKMFARSYNYHKRIYVQNSKEQILYLYGGIDFKSHSMREFYLERLKPYK